MLLATPRILFVLATLTHFSTRLQAQTPAPGQLQRVQPGLENAVKWKWSILPSQEKDWGFSIPEPIEAPDSPRKIDPATPIPAPGKKKEGSPLAAISIFPGEYEVKRGDALAIIARKAGLSLNQLKVFNALSSDIIRIGQILKIPTQEEYTAFTPPPPPTPIATAEPKKGKKSIPKAPVEPEVDQEFEATLLQVFLDRENFSAGPIDGNQGASFEKLLAIYRSLHQELETPEALRAKAIATMGAPFTRFKLKRSDLRFIAAPKAVSPTTVLPPKTKTPKTELAPKAPTLPPLTYEELSAATYSAYRTPWEFVAERFHCDEAFLRSLNPKIKEPITVESDFKVPNVIPFEIEKCFEQPLQPTADPDKPITAAIVELSRLEIRQAGQLIALMPISRARPDLRGKGSWTILDATPAPRLTTKQEPTNAPKLAEPNAALNPAAPPVALPPVAEQTLAAGPRNPVGIYWINLAKANSSTALPYGLHGTSIPSRMKTSESIGGLRLTNWDIARAVRMLPQGTPLRWQ